MIGIVFLIIDYDLFHSEPKFLVTEGYFWKGIAIVFQLTFIAILIQWDKKKKRIINILSKGIITEGKLKMSERIKPNKFSTFYIHLFEYYVFDKKYEITIKNKTNSIKSNYIIYESNNPKNGILYEDLKSELKHLIKKKHK